MARRRIAILPDAVANRIAAGEVVERPSSVVKELVENSIDAGATAVAVEIEAGGKSLVRVADDGEGMLREDALLALDRHATSKVRSAEDLVGITSLGFRGEALPSIAAVSMIELETAAPEEPVGTRIVASGGRVTAVEDVARRPGTTVTVRALFHNLPARRKFLRSTRSESRAAEEALTTLALALPNVAFTLLTDGKRLLDVLPSNSFAERVAQVVGREYAATLIPVDYTEHGVSVAGLVQRPADATEGGRRVYLFVNGRPFRDPFLVRAAERGYRATIPAGVRPGLLLRFTVAPDAVDVNVHPAKLEVRFRDRFALEAAVEAAVRSALGELSAAAPVGQGGLPWEHRAVAVPRFGARVETPRVDLFGASPEVSTPPGGDPSGAPGAGATAVEAEPEAPEQMRPAALRVLGQIHEAFILVEAADGLLIVDQHSGHERVLFERIMQALGAGGATSQKLLFPLTLELSPPELDALERHRELVAGVGYELESFGGRSVIVHAVPAPHPRFDAARCLREMVSDLAGERFGGMANRLERIASTFACRAAIKAGQALTRPEMEELVDRLFASHLPAHDVHGRPTIVQLPRAELERRFGRR
jgi:DNA mismatch repair protein MutL